MGYLKSLGTGFVWICTFLAAITFIPGIPPTVDYTPYNFKLPESLNNELLGNLNDAEILLKGKIKGPEAFDVYDGVLYTTLHGGEVSKWDGNKFVKVVKFGEKCDGLWEEEKCGRPLGLKFDKNGNLYVVDAYYGIFKVDVKTGKYEKIVDTSKPIEGQVPLIPNSIDVDHNGNLYWTDSSTEYKLYDGVYTMLSNPSGRLIRYNAKTKKNEVLLENLGFANGLKLSKDESFIVVAETITSRLIKYHLKGSKSGQSEIFIEGLPGLPDNIHGDSNGNFIVSIVVQADEENPALFQSLAPHPNFRKMLNRLLSVIEIPLKFINEYYPNVYIKKWIHSIGHFESTSLLAAPTVIILRIDPNGKVINVLSATDGKISGISSAFLTDDYLWLGSPYNDYVARVPTEKVFPELKKTEPKVAAKKVNQQAAKPDNSQKEKPITTAKPIEAKTTTTTTTTTTPAPTTTTPKPKPASKPAASPSQPAKKPEPTEKVVEKPKVKQDTDGLKKKQENLRQTESKVKAAEKPNVVREQETKPVKVSSTEKDKKKNIPVKDEM